MNAARNGPNAKLPHDADDNPSAAARALSHIIATGSRVQAPAVQAYVQRLRRNVPDASPAELRDATVTIAKEHWNRYYAPVLGGKDSSLLGIYSHMVTTPLYLPDYPLGHLIALQVEEQVKKGGALGVEFERMAKCGAVIPDVWMTNATGSPVSADPLLRAAEEALKGMSSAKGASR